jgi:long-chain acyl-CoA synthetase
VDKIWLNSYSPGTSSEINPNAYQSIVEVIDQSVQRFPDRPAFYNLGITLTYREVADYSRRFATYLQQDLGLKKGDRIAIMLPNILQYPVAMFGALQAGIVVVNVNPLYTVDELTYQLNNSGAETIITLTNFAATLEKALPQVPTLKNIIMTRLGDLFPLLKSWAINLTLKYVYKKIPDWHIPHAIPFKQTLKNTGGAFVSVPLHSQDIAFLQYTGGTTGVSKGAILTHHNIVSNLQQADAWCKQTLVDGKEIIITALPLYHIFSLLANCLFFTKLGGLNILITNPRDIPSIIKEMKKFKFTAITGVNTLFKGLLKNPHFASLDFSHLHLTLGGGMAVQKSVAEEWQKVTGAPLLEAYGLTEASPCVTINPVDLPRYNGSIGLPVPSTEVALLDNDGQEMPAGEIGELAIKGPQVMQGYWQNTAETEKVFTRDGWLLTGDMASIDEKGFVHIVERKKDMILVSGFNVYPNEIEDVLSQMPGVQECAVVGILDDLTGEAVKAYIVKNNPKITKEDVIKYSREHLTGYKVPKQIEFRSDLPKSNVGKILRRTLKDEAVHLQ